MSMLERALYSTVIVVLIGAIAALHSSNSTIGEPAPAAAEEAAQ